jgi:hypothetical protein
MRSRRHAAANELFFCKRKICRAIAAVFGQKSLSHNTTKFDSPERPKLRRDGLNSETFLTVEPLMSAFPQGAGSVSSLTLTPLRVGVKKKDQFSGGKLFGCSPIGN